MPKQRQKRTALLLIAILAILPLHGIQAALNSLSHQHGDGHSPVQHAGHLMSDASGTHACKTHQQQAPDTAPDHQCDGTGCDMCGACSANIPAQLPLQLSHDRILPEPAEDVQQLRSQTYDLFRPPRA